MDTCAEDEGISLALLEPSVSVAQSAHHSASSSGVFSTESSGVMDSLTRALEELRLRDSDVEVEEEIAKEAVAEAAAAAAERSGWEDAEAVIKRCSSLKGGSSQGAGGGRRRRPRKAVRFADALGLDLASVRHVARTDSSPPAEAAASSRRPRLFISPCFQQPGSCAGFISRVMTQKVTLERAGFSGPSAISGVVRVRNLHFEKRVDVRVSCDGWRTSWEVAATFRAPEPDSGCGGGGEDGGGSGGMTDQFVFEIRLPAGFGSTAGDRLAFCVRYQVAGETFWDSNFGENYAFDCLPGVWDPRRSTASFR